MDITWLGELEDRVRLAGEELTQLRLENKKLRAKVQRMEKSAAAVVVDPTGDWAEERDEVRQRVARLVVGLEELLDD